MDALSPGVHGRWRILAVEQDGERFESQPSDELFAIIRGNRFTIEEIGQTSGPASTFRCDQIRHRFDFLDEAGIVDSPGIYCLDGTQLLICAALRVLSAGQAPLSQPPTGFFTTNGSGWRLWILQRPT